MAVRVLLLTQWFDPEPTFKGLLFARELVKLGIQVEVVTGFPNYPGGGDLPWVQVTNAAKRSDRWCACNTRPTLSKPWPEWRWTYYQLCQLCRR